MNTDLNKAWSVLLIVCCLFVYAGCRLPSAGASSNSAAASEMPSGGTSTTVQDDSLFAETQSGSLRKFSFYTSDQAYISNSGYTFWSLNKNIQNPFIARTVHINKLSGDSAAGYGIVFCHHDAGSSGSLEKMLIVLINTKGEYTIGEAVGGVFSYIKDWAISPNIKIGYNQENTIGLALNGRIFTLCLNGVEAARFTALEESYELAGGDGCIAVISPLENFPSVPVSISYTE